MMLEIRIETVMKMRRWTLFSFAYAFAALHVDAGSFSVVLERVRKNGSTLVMNDVMGLKMANNDSKKSKSAEATGKVFEIQYGTGSAKGFFYRDIFAFGSGSKRMQFKNKIMFGGGQKMTFGDIGILGLSFMPEGEKGTSIFQQAVKEGLVDKPIFTTYLTKCQTEHCPNGGLITFGAEDKQNCGKVETWAKVVPGSMHWMFKMDEFLVNGKRIAGSHQAITDTGTSEIFMPEAAAKQFAKLVGATADEGHFIKCSARFKATLVVNGRKLDITNEQLVIPFADTKECRLAISGQDDNVWLLGDPWIRTFCHVHDFKQRRIGLAPTKGKPNRRTKSKKSKRRVFRLDKSQNIVSLPNNSKGRVDHANSTEKHHG